MILNKKDKALLESFDTVINPNLIDEESLTVELHLYDKVGNQIHSKHDTKDYNVFLRPLHNEELNSEAKVQISFEYEETLKELNVESGKFVLRYNLLENILGSSSGDRVYIDEISPSRKEIRIRPIVVSDSNESWHFLNNIKMEDRILNYSINFGDNKIYQISNFVFDNIKFNDSIGSYVLKLYEKLPQDFSVKEQLWICEEKSEPITFSIELTQEIEEKVFKSLREPNFDIKIKDKKLESTGYKTWDKLLSNDENTAQRILNSHISSSIHGGEVKLAIDYSNYENFVHFGSAQERLKNFLYKMKLVEVYDSQTDWLSTITSSVEVANSTNKFVRNKNTLINNFDEYEKYLYWSSASYYEDSFGVHYNDTWPKENAVTPYTQSSVASVTAADGWFDEQLARAEAFDNSNDHGLINTVPEHLKIVDYGDNLTVDLTQDGSGSFVSINKNWTGSPSDEYIAFIYMIGQYFDTHWTYIKALTSTDEREHNVDLGIAKDLLFDVAESIGIKLNNGKNLVDLWEYTLGEQISGSWSGGSVGSGSYVQTNTGRQSEGEFESISSKQYTQEIWNRLINNLPYLLKTKGTRRGIRALLNCYGIPPTVIQIREYGGPDVSGSNTTGQAKMISLNHSVRFDAGNDSYFFKNYADDSIAKTLELRFAVSESDSYPERQCLLDVETFGKITLIYSGSGMGWLEYDPLVVSDEFTSSLMPLFDGDFWNVGVVYNVDPSPNEAIMRTKKSKNGNIIYDDVVSGSDFSLHSATYSATLGRTFGGIEYFTGSLQEFRIWDIELSDTVRDNHAKFIRAVNTDASSTYDNLIHRYTFDNAKNLHSGADPSVQDINPSQLNINNLDANNFPDEADYPYNFNYTEEEMSALIPNIGGNQWTNNKIRTEENIKYNLLDPLVKVTRNSGDFAPIDSNKIGIYFSPTNIINEDIIATYADYNFDNFIGDPRDYNKVTYTELDGENREYWKKYTSRNSFKDYIQWIRSYDKTLFEHIKRMLAARAQKHVGLLIEPHILERHKIKHKTISYDRLDYSDTINIEENLDINSEKLNYISEINVNNNTSVDSEKLNYISEIDYSVQMEAVGTSHTYVGLFDCHSSVNTSDSSYESLDALLESYENKYNSTVYARGNIRTDIADLHYEPNWWQAEGVVQCIYSIREFPQLGYDNLESGSSIYSAVTASYTLTNGNTKKYIRYYTKVKNVKADVNVYKGTLQTEDTTPDKKAAVEIFINNPNTLIVNDGGKTKLRIE